MGEDDHSQAEHLRDHIERRFPARYRISDLQVRKSPVAPAPWCRLNSHPQLLLSGGYLASLVDISGTQGRSESVCVYTVLVGGYEDLLEQPVARDSDTDFICFTDDPSLKSASWQVRPFTCPLPSDPGRSSRYPKICAHRFLPDYEVSLYVDNSVELSAPPRVVIDQFLPEGAGMALNEHSFRDTVEDEFAAVVDAGLDASWVCAEQLAHYGTEDPQVLMLKPLWTGLMVRRHNSPEVVEAMEQWWWNVLRYSRRDQLSIWRALRAVNLGVEVRDFDIHQSPLHSWPKSTGRDKSLAGALPTVPELDECRAALDRAMSDLLARESGLSERDRRIDEMGLDLAEKDRAIDRQESLVADLQSMTESLNAQLADARIAAAYAMERLGAIEASTSWRVTKPLRSLSRMLRS